MTYTFVRAKNKRSLNLDYGYLLEISSETSFLDYLENFHVKLVKDGILDAAKEVTKRSHCATSMGSAIYSLAMIRGSDILTSSAKLTDDFVAGALEAIRKCGKIYFQKCGSYLVGNKSLKILKTIVQEKLVWPEKQRLTMDDVKIKKWQGGIHYYVRVAGIDVGKFKTPTLAREGARKYIRRHNKIKY